VPRSSLTQVLGHAARRTGLTKPAFRALEHVRAARGARRVAAVSDGLPLPPALLRVRVTGNADPDAFLEGGAVGARVIRETVERHRPGGMQSLGAVLDFGCGCGRIARNWASVEGPSFHGCDLNPELVEWCRENLPFLTPASNSLSPPLPYGAESFDLVYATSVFTHLSERSQFEWMAELRRVLRPDGMLLFTTKGDSLAYELEKPGRPGPERYRAGQLVVTDVDAEGLNLCAAYHPHGWVVENMLDGFELLEFTPSGAAMVGDQDLYLVRRR
jgi:ubiquinone/menaquinone biosynthesis C-methylase UbiE